MGWLFGNKDNSRTETKTVNDNGKLKELQLTITGPDSTMVVTGDEYRTTVPLRGNQPVAAEEVSIERKAPNGMWLNSLIPFYDGDVKGTQKKARSLWQLPAVEGKSQGGWMNKFQNGGSTQPTQDQAMKELMAIVQQAATELQSNKPGQGVQTLAQIANDPQGSQLLDVLVQQVPEAGQIVEAVMKMVGAFKCGGKAKKKVKKGAKGCVPCKKLMKVGGKLVNVWSDCEGIISKHQAGGWLIPKGEDGLEAKYKVSSAYRTNKTGTGITGQQHYFIGVDGNLYNQQVNDAGLWDQGTLVTSGFDDENFKNWSNSLGADSSFWATGFNQDKNTFDTEANARAAMGDAYDTGVITGQTVHGVTATGNKYIGDTPDNLKVTANQYVQHHGGWQNAMQAENDIFKAKRRASRQLRREQIKNINRGGSYDPDGAGSEPALTGSAARQAVRDSRRKYMDNAKTTRVANQAAILNTQTPKLNTVTPVSMSGTGSTTTNLPENTTLAKQGGWLTKFN